MGMYKNTEQVQGSDGHSSTVSYDEIDPYELAEAVRAIAAEQPDFVYKAPAGSPKCFYTTETGVPDCIIGHAMARIGKPMPPQNHLTNNIDVPEEHPECPLLDNGVSGNPWLNAFGYSSWQFTADVVKWLAVVQQEQDVCVPWGEAVKTANEKYPEAFVKI